MYKELESPNSVNFQFFVRAVGTQAGQNPHIDSILVRSFSYEFPGQAPVTLMQNFAAGFWQQGTPQYGSDSVPPVQCVAGWYVDTRFDLVLNGKPFTGEQRLDARERSRVYPLILEALQQARWATPMNNRTVFRVGAVLSADIAVPEHELVVRFYSRVLTTGADPFWREDLMNNRGTPIIGVGARSADYAALPLQWMPHIQVADVAASVKRAQALGGKVLLKDESAASEWAVLLDPNGAAFGLIPVVPAEQLPPAGDDAQGVGRIAWLDLTVADAAATRDFYTEVIGWTVQDVAMKDGDERYADYAMLGGDGTAVAGVCHARGVNLGIPPVWMIYLPVGDLAESVRRVGEEGGTVIREMRGGDGQLAFAIIQDPALACLALAAASAGG